MQVLEGLFLVVNASLVLSQSSCPPIEATAGASWIHVSWSVCDGVEPLDVEYYELDVADMTEYVNNMTYTAHCRRESCELNMTLARACLDYEIQLSLVTETETLQYDQVDITTQEEIPSAPLGLTVGSKDDNTLDITWQHPETGALCVQQYDVSVWSKGLLMFKLFISDNLKTFLS